MRVTPPAAGDETPEIPIRCSRAVVSANGFWSLHVAIHTRALGALTGRASFVITMRGKALLPGTKRPAPIVMATVGPGTFSICSTVSDDESAVGRDSDPQPAARTVARARTAARRPTRRV